MLVLFSSLKSYVAWLGKEKKLVRCLQPYRCWFIGGTEYKSKTAEPLARSTASLLDHPHEAHNILYRNHIGNTNGPFLEHLKTLCCEPDVDGSF